MKITISAGGKFHALHLAEQMERRGHLHKLLTPYYSEKRKWLPRLRHDRERISPEKVSTNLFPLAFGKVLNAWPGARESFGEYYAAELFDRWAAGRIDPCDVAVAWSGFAFGTLRQARSLGALTMVERGSTHILFQKAILEEEYARYGIKAHPVNDRMAQKETAEYEEADCISVPSQFARQTFLDQGVSSEKIICVPYGVNLSSFHPLPKEDSVFRVLVVGGLTLRKGIQYLLEALTQLNLKNSELLIVGSIDSELHPFFKRYPGEFRIIHKVPQSELVHYYSQASVFVLPSIEEGFSMVIPQAMACGIPVICTTNSGGADIVRDGIDGCMVPIRNVEILKEKILRLYDNEKELKTMGEAAAGRAAQFTWDTYGDHIVSLYRSLLKGKAG